MNSPVQFQTLTFTINSGGATTGTQTAQFVGNSINQVDVAIKAINVSYSNGTEAHQRSNSIFVPSAGIVSGTQVPVKLTFNYSTDDTSADDYMTGTVQVLVIAYVS